MKLQTLHLSKERTFRKPPVPGTASPSSGAAASRLRTAQASSFEYQKKESPLDGSSRSRAHPKIPAWIKVTFCDIIAPISVESPPSEKVAMNGRTELRRPQRFR